VSTTTKGALATGGFLLGTGPSIAQARRDLRIGLFGGDFGNISPMLRADIQGGIITRNIFDPMAEVDYKSRNIVPFVAEAWKVLDPLTWRIKLREGMMWHRGYGEVTAEEWSGFPAEFSNAVKKELVYPHQALEAGESGYTLLCVSLDRDSRVLGVSISRSSGWFESGKAWRKGDD